jgi:two-component system, NarL family, response regulator DesR
VRVLICDDSFGFPTIVLGWLNDDDRFEHVGTAETGRELLGLAETVEADAILLDLVLPDVDNPAALVSELRRKRPRVRILLVSSLAVPELERAAAAAGADDFCHKAITAKALGDALYDVATRP